MSDPDDMHMCDCEYCRWCGEVPGAQPALNKEALEAAKVMAYMISTAEFTFGTRAYEAAQLQLVKTVEALKKAEARNE